MPEWKDFYVMVGGAAAALTGLVLVSVSLHVRAVLSHPLYRDRAFASLVGLVTIFAVAAAVLAPQGPTTLGYEVLALGAVWVVRLVRFLFLYGRVRRRGHGPQEAVFGFEWVLWSVMSFTTIVWNAWVLLAEVSS